MPSRSRSPEKRQPSDFRDASGLEKVRSGADIANRRLDRGNPQTPPTQRFTSASTYSSPGSILGREEDAVIVELNPRYLLAGIEGESCPQCRINFTPDNNRRVGDYRAWLPEYTRSQESLDDWGTAYELWRNNIDRLNMDLIGDKLERSIRQAYNQHLLVDAGMARMVLVLPSLVPHPVLDTMLSTLFQRWKYSSITLLPNPTMAVFSAGLRSALVIDIDWEETTVTAVHEYRELHVCRSSKGMKIISQKLAQILQKLKKQQEDGDGLRIDVPFVDEVLARTLPSLNFSTNKFIASEDLKSSAKDSPENLTSSENQELEIEWPCENTTKLVKIAANASFAAVQDTLLFGSDDQYADDEELAIPQLAYKVLMALSFDTRTVCMPRIVFTGQLATHKSLTARIINEIRLLVEARGWSSVRGKRLNPQRSGLMELAQVKTAAADATYGVEQESGKDYVENRVRQLKARRNQPLATSPEVREVKSLGSWAGASLLTSLKVRGFVEIERDRYLSHGIFGASRDTDISIVAQPQRMSSFGLPKATKAQDRLSWTLAGWG